MIELEIGKAIVAVEVEGRPTSAENVKARCGDCCFYNSYKNNCESEMLCSYFARKDGKSVIYKIVDYPPQTELYVDGMRHGSKTTDGR